MTDALRKALFLDRDGIINEDTAYPHTPDQIRFNEAVFPLCRKAQERGYLLVVITNQAGVAKGKFAETAVQSLHCWMAEEFRRRGIEIAAFYYCPHHPEAPITAYRRTCDCRKPGPGMVVRAAKELGIDVRRSLVIGDKPSDRIALANLRSVIVKSRYTGEDYDIEDLAQAEGFLEKIDSGEPSSPNRS